MWWQTCGFGGYRGTFGFMWWQTCGFGGCQETVCLFASANTMVGLMKRRQSVMGYR